MIVEKKQGVLLKRQCVFLFKHDPLVTTCRRAFGDYVADERLVTLAPMTLSLVFIKYGFEVASKIFDSCSNRLKYYYQRTYESVHTVTWSFSQFISIT